jgi:CRP/FNR family transcriptional regulator
MITSLHCDDCQARLIGCFSGLDREDLNELDRVKISTVYKKGQAIFHEGMEPTGVYCLHSGKVKLSRNGMDGREQIVRVAVEGGLLGIRAALGGRPYSSTATALEDSVVCYINKCSFFRFQINNPTISTYLMTQLSKLLDEAEVKITSLAHKSVRERVAETLLVLHNIFTCEQLNTVPPKDTPMINLSREDLSNIVGTATETLVRALTELKNEGLVDIRGRRIYLVNIEGLKKVARIFQ